MSKKTKMTRELDLMVQLPRETCIEILSRLPIRSIIQSKLVCPRWRDLIESPEFAQFVPRHHLLEFPLMSSSRNPIHKNWPWPYKFLHELLGFNISIVRIGVSNSIPLVRSSVNGLILLLHRHSFEQQHLWVCNPITLEYLTIPNPPHFINYYFEYGPRGALAYPNHPNYGNYNFGFGVSRRSNEYKVVWVSGRSEWHVFTLGLGARWRTLSEGPTLGRYDRWNMECALLTGNLYWLDPEITASRFWCFDLETEVFTTFSAPPPPPPCQSYRRTSCVLKECLCLCDMSLRSAGDAEIEVWLMSNRGIGKEGNWSKEYVIREGFNRRSFGNLFPFKVLEDGLLLGKSGQPDVHHSNFINGVRRSLYTASSIPFPVDWYPRAAVYSPNFLPLKTLLKDMEEEVQSLWTPLT